MKNGKRILRDADDLVLEHLAEETEGIVEGFARQVVERGSRC